MAQKFIEKMSGFKGTNKDMTCQGHRFKLGVWYEIDGEIELCKRGFHFCKHPSGPWAYYPDGRVFECEAEQVLELPAEPGADYKLVAKRIRLTKEVKTDKKSNSGDYNSGYRNSGDYNSGYRNSGDCNSGYCNSGDYNSGYRNSGDCNSGYCNSGDCNSGDRNSGYYNSGDYNSGYRNSGHYNATDGSSGFFNSKPERVTVFDTKTRMTYDQFTKKYPEWSDLGDRLMGPEPIDFAPFKRIPGITPAKLRALHKKHLAFRSKK